MQSLPGQCGTASRCGQVGNVMRALTQLLCEGCVRKPGYPLHAASRANARFAGGVKALHGLKELLCVHACGRAGADWMQQGPTGLSRVVPFNCACSSQSLQRHI